MQKKFTTAMVRQQYQRLISQYITIIPDAALKLRVTLAADHYFRSCALCVWARGGGVSDAHVEAYNAICSRGSTPPDALYFEVMSRVAENPSFTAPVFYDDLLSCDSVRGTRLAAQFRSMSEALLLMFAAVDDRVTQQEADYVESCIDWLRGYQPGQSTPHEVKRPVTQTPTAPIQPETREAPPAEEEAKPEEEPEPTTEELLQQLDELCGLDQVKKDVHSMINLIKVRRLREEHGLPVPPMSLHLVFLGNPGTGKTTVARLLAKLYKSIGVLSKGQLVETDRSGLVAGYVGQTATKTREVVEKALGGILFIDEAYALTSQTGQNDFGHEAIEVILKCMEDHRDQLIVIVAGYQDLMEEFIHSNPGLASRFNKYFLFEDYNGAQLMQIFTALCEKNGYQPDEETRTHAEDYFNRLFEQRDENFGNARDVRNIFEAMIVAQSDRVSQLENPTVDDLMQVTREDFRIAAEEDEDEDEDNSDGGEAADEVADEAAESC